MIAIGYTSRGGGVIYMVIDKAWLDLASPAKIGHTKNKNDIALCYCGGADDEISFLLS